MSARSLRLKERMRAGDYLVGGWLSFADPAAAEIVAASGFDWVFIDTEHAPFSPMDLHIALMAFKGSDAVPIVRVPFNDAVHIKRALDLGADGILVPMVKTADEARAAVAASKYPPEGTRGFGPRRASEYYQRIDEYLDGANASLIVVPQIEHEQAVADLDAILAVKGIDAVCLGPMDLAASMGRLGEFEDPGVQDALARVAAVCRQHRMPCCLGLACPPDVMLKWAVQGVRLIIAAEDQIVFRDATSKAIEAIRSGLAKQGEVR